MIVSKQEQIGGIRMNNFNTLFSLIRGRSNQRFFNMFGNKKTNNGSMILWSLLGLTTLGVIGSYW